jgi:hypothetical protein
LPLLLDGISSPPKLSAIPKTAASTEPSKKEKEGTGNAETRQPGWVENMAQAMKASLAEYIDPSTVSKARKATEKAKATAGRVRDVVSRRLRRISNQDKGIERQEVQAPEVLVGLLERFYAAEIDERKQKASDSIAGSEFHARVGQRIRAAHQILSQTWSRVYTNEGPSQEA